MHPIHTSLHVGAFALFYVFLAYRVTEERQASKTSLGTDAPGSPLTKSVRVHANFGEYVPFALMLIAFAEMNGTPVIAIHSLAGLLLLARVLHAYGITKVSGRSPFRFWGTALTFLVVGVAGMWASVLSFLHLLG